MQLKTGPVLGKSLPGGREPGRSQTRRWRQSDSKDPALRLRLSHDRDEPAFSAFGSRPNFVFFYWSDADKDLHFLVKDEKSLENVNTFSPFFERNQIMSESK